MKNPKFQIYKDKAGEFRFRLRAGNGEIVLTGEGYKTKASCENGIASVRTNAANDARFERKTGSNGQQYFILKAANGQEVARSGMYKSASGISNGIKVIKSVATDAPVEEEA